MNLHRIPLITNFQEVYRGRYFSRIILRLSNVRLTLLRGIPPVDTADVGKNMNILCQRGK